MTFIETLISEGYIFDDENYDGCYVKTDENDITHCYQEGEDEGDWNYVQFSPFFNVIKEYTFSL